MLAPALSVVRLVKIAGIDLRRFEFDHDLTWFCFFLNADETIYGRYGAGTRIVIRLPDADERRVRLVGGT